MLATLVPVEQPQFAWTLAGTVSVVSGVDFPSTREKDRPVKTFLKILRLEFLPASPDASLLALRLWLGLTLLLNHGLGKLMKFGEMASEFPDPLGVGHTPSLVLAVFGEVVCSTLLVLGLFGRFAALGLTVNMAVAFLLVHQAKLAMGPGSGELAFAYLAGFVALLIAGTGRFSLDRSLFAGGGAPKS